MATDAYEAAIKGLKDLLRYDNILSASKGQSLHKSVGIHIHLQRSKLLFFVLLWFTNHHHFLISALYYFA